MSEFARAVVGHAVLMSPHAVMGPEMLDPELRNRVTTMNDQEMVSLHFPDARCVTRESRERRVSYCVISDRAVQRNQYGVVRGIGVWCSTEDEAWFDAAQRIRHEFDPGRNWFDPAVRAQFDSEVPRG